MKKIIILLVICCGFFTTMAQSPLNIGIHGGVSSTKIKVKDIGKPLDARANTGYMIGAFARVNLGPIYVEPSLNFAHREAEMKSGSEKGNLKYNSFDIPVMVGIHLLDLSAIKLRAYLGPCASFCGKLKWNKEIFGNFIDNDKVMWTGKVGIGVDVWKLTFDMDYEKGLKKFQDNKYGKIKAPRSFNFTLGLKFI